MLRLFRLYEGGGMGAGYLPQSGGSGEQAAIMMEAFAFMQRCQAEAERGD